MDEIIIKNADKGGAVVIQNRMDCLKVSDINFYTKMENNLTKLHMQEINYYIEKMFENN